MGISPLPLHSLLGNSFPPASVARFTLVRISWGRVGDNWAGGFGVLGGMKRDMAYRNRICLAAGLMGLAFGVGIGASALRGWAQAGEMVAPATSPASGPAVGSEIKWAVDSVEMIGGVKALGAGGAGGGCRCGGGRWEGSAF